MSAKRFLSALLALALAVSCVAVPASAAAYTEDNAAIARAVGRLNYSIPANSRMNLGDTFYLNAGDKISYDCTYSPSSASMDFGYIGPDGKFHFINCTDGSIDKTIQVSRQGIYQLTVRNNEDCAVAVKGTVNY